MSSVVNFVLVYSCIDAFGMRREHGDVSKLVIFLAQDSAHGSIDYHVVGRPYSYLHVAGSG